MQLRKSLGAENYVQPTSCENIQHIYFRSLLSPLSNTTNRHLRAICQYQLPSHLPRVDSPIVCAVPVINDDPGDSSHSTRFAASDGCAARFNAIWLKSNLVPRMEADCLNIGVSIGPGQKQLHRICREPNSFAAVFVRPTTACFEAR